MGDLGNGASVGDSVGGSIAATCFHSDYVSVGGSIVIVGVVGVGYAGVENNKLLQ